MKKLFLSLVFTMVSIASFGQNWSTKSHEADELTEQDSYTSYVYEDPNVGSFIYWSNQKDQFRIISKNGIFNYESVYNQGGSHYCGFDIIVGLYDENNKLVEKFSMWLDCPSSDGKPTFGETRNRGKLFNPIGQSKKVKKILTHLQTTGYVRILADLYGNSKFDLKVNHQ